jgi:hypothetical protein
MRMPIFGVAEALTLPPSRLSCYRYVSVQVGRGSAQAWGEWAVIAQASRPALTPLL